MVDTYISCWFLLTMQHVSVNCHMAAPDLALVEDLDCDLVASVHMFAHCVQRILDTQQTKYS